MFIINSSVRRIVACAVLPVLLLAAGCSASPDESQQGESSESASALTNRSARFETFVGEDGQTYFDLIAANGENVLHSEGYESEAGAQAGIQSLVENGKSESSYQVKQAKDGEFYFDVVAANGETVSTSELYVSEANANRAGSTVRTILEAVPMPETRKATRTARFEVYTGSDGKAYFRLRAGNGEIMLGSQGYSTRSSARRGITSVIANGIDATRYDFLECGDGDVRIRLIANNGAVIATGQPYASESGAERAVARIGDLLEANPPVVEN